jgi:hypothetical protein
VVLPDTALGPGEFRVWFTTQSMSTTAFQLEMMEYMPGLTTARAQSGYTAVVNPEDGAVYYHCTFERVVSEHLSDGVLCPLGFVTQQQMIAGKLPSEAYKPEEVILPDGRTGRQGYVIPQNLAEKTLDDIKSWVRDQRMRINLSEFRLQACSAAAEWDFHARLYVFYSVASS